MELRSPLQRNSGWAMMRAGRVAVLVGLVLGGKSGVVVADDYNHKVCICARTRWCKGSWGAGEGGWLSVQCLYLTAILLYCVQYSVRVVLATLRNTVRYVKSVWGPSFSRRRHHRASVYALLQARDGAIFLVQMGSALLRPTIFRAWVER